MKAHESQIPRARSLSPVPPTRSSLLGASMLAAIVIVTGLAWWDEQREAGAALRDLGTEQAVVAASLGNSLRAHLSTMARDAILIGEHGTIGVSGSYAPAVVRASSEPATREPPPRLLLSFPLADGRVVDLGVMATDLLEQPPPVNHAGELRILFVRPGDERFHSTSGGTLSCPSLRAALDREATVLRLSRTEAAQIGLLERTAMAGLTHVEAGPFGRWEVVAVATAARERDREARAQWRLVLGVTVASALVLAFGGVALRKQRKELELARELAVAEVLRQRDAELVRAARVATMATFAMGVAHEVATPLGVIVGRAEQVLARVKADERATRGAELIIQQADRIQLIVRRFLDLARGGVPAMGREDPAMVVHSAVASVEHRFAQAGVALTTDVSAGIPHVRCDRGLLEHALVNLLLNACEACDAGGHVEIAVRSDAERVAFVVTDDGAGITPENAARAMEPFFTTKPAGSGTGLGLAIAAEIAKSHRGELTIAANSKKGTRACIEIPIAAPGGLDA